MVFPAQNPCRYILLSFLQESVECDLIVLAVEELFCTTMAEVLFQSYYSDRWCWLINRFITYGLHGKTKMSLLLESGEK